VLTHASLRCRLCERTHALAPLSACPICGGPLDVADAARPDPAGGTPLSRARQLSDQLGVEVLLKNEDASATHSFKDRLAAGAVDAAQAFGLETVCCASTGNLGEAVAARCASVGLEAVVLRPADSPPPLPAATYGAKILSVAAGFDECRRLEHELERLFPWGFVSGNLQAIAAEGAKAVAYEIVEQLGERFPDAVVAPVASGTLFTKLAQGFDELSAAGTPGLRPRLYGAQAGGCPPVASAWADDRPLSRVRPDTEIRSLAIGDPVFGELAVGAARMSAGAIHAVPEDEIAGHSAFLAETTGLVADSAAGVALGVLRGLVAAGEISAGERVVLVVTGSALKPYGFEAERPAQEVGGDVDSLLSALGVAA